MAAFSTYSSDKILDLTLNQTSWTAPTNIYLGLFTSDAGLADNVEGSQTEVAAADYERVDVTSAFDAASSGSCANTSEILFDTAESSWGEISHVAVMDALTSGNVLYWGALTASRTVESGDAPRFAVDNFTITIS